MGYSIMLFFAPPYITLAILLGICVAVLYVGKAIVGINGEDISDPKGSIRSLVFQTWGLSIAAFYLSLIIMFVISWIVPFFQWFHSEWDTAKSNAYIPAAIYLVCWTLAYAAFFYRFSYTTFKSTITHEAKRKKLHLAVVGISATLWAALMFLIYFVILIRRGLA